jgi:hypothetical protein
MELMKLILLIDLLGLYIFSALGLICYLSASAEGDNFKQ